VQFAVQQQRWRVSSELVSSLLAGFFHNKKSKAKAIHDP
jgi:hypothetical protein